jgi:MFS family permease
MLPLLPSLVERQLGGERVALHTGLLTAAYTLPLALFAPLIGGFADRRSKKAVLLAGLTGFAISIGLFAIVGSLAAMYAGRLLSGLFAAAVVPVAFAAASDWSSGDEARARHFAWINGSAILGAVAGPAVGGIIGGMWRQGMPVSGAPFLLVAALALAVALFSLATWPAAHPEKAGATSGAAPRTWSTDLRAMLLFSAITAAALGIFEVGLALRAERSLGLGPRETGLMFVECMVVMFVAQLVAFNPWVPARSSRRLFAPALGLLAMGLALLGTVQGALLYWAVAAVAAAAGLLSPLIAYWISLLAGAAQGRELGLQTAIAGLGQTAGSAAAGALFGISTGLAFFLGSAAALVGLGLALPVERRLAASAGDRSRPP